MDNGMAMVTVAVITTVGGVMVALIQSMRKENRADHATVQDSLYHLERIALRTEDKVDTVREELEEHLAWHEGEEDGRPGGRDTEREEEAEEHLPY